MLAWAQERRTSLVYDGTVGSLVRWYETAEDSPYRDLKSTTAVTYKKMLKPLLAGKAALLVEDITGADVRRWFKELQVGRFGLSRHQHFQGGLGVRIEQPRYAVYQAAAGAQGHALRKSGDTELTYPQLMGFRRAAMAVGRPSMALGVTLQFELGMRQKDVIGEWVDAPGVDGIRDKKGRRWVNGLTGFHIDAAGGIKKRTTKTGAKVEHTIHDYPELAAMLVPILERDRGSPLVINEHTRQPYSAKVYRNNWRRIARLAGIPDEICNMDARAGAVTEAYENEATTEEAMAFAGHTQAKTSRRYLRRVQKQSSRVAKGRVEGRGQ